MRGVIEVEEIADEETFEPVAIRRPHRVASIPHRRRWPETLPATHQAAAAAVHHLRSPLASALANLEMLEDPTAGELTKTQQAHLQYAFESLYDLEQTVGDLITLASLRSRSLPCAVGPVDICKLVSSIHRRMAPRASRLGVNLRLDPGGCHATVRTDARLLAYLVTELVENAIRHSGGRGAVDVVLRSGVGEYVELSVLDEGPGIAFEAQDTGPTVRRPATPDTASAVTGGTGMGLNIVAHLARTLRIRLSSARRESGGSLFRLEIPSQTSY